MQKFSTKCMKIELKNTVKTQCSMPKEVFFQGYKDSSAYEIQKMQYTTGIMLMTQVTLISL